MSATRPPLPKLNATKQESRLLALLVVTNLLLLSLAVNRGWPPPAWRVLAVVLPHLSSLWRVHHAGLLLPLVFTLLEAASLPVCALLSVSTVVWWLSTSTGFTVRQLLVWLPHWGRTPLAQGPARQDQGKGERPVQAEPVHLGIQMTSAGGQQREEELVPSSDAGLDRDQIVLHPGRQRSFFVLIEGTTPQAALLVKETLKEVLLPVFEQVTDPKRLQGCVLASLQEAHQRLSQQSLLAAEAVVQQSEHEGGQTTRGPWTALISGLFFVGAHELSVLAHVGSPRPNQVRPGALQPWMPTPVEPRCVQVVREAGFGQPGHVDLVPEPLLSVELVLLFEQGLWKALPEPSLDQTMGQADPLCESATFGAMLDFFTAQIREAHHAGQRASVLLLRIVEEKDASVRYRDAAVVRETLL